MEAFQKNIDALDRKIELLIQKWTDTLEINKTLKERNKELEEKLNLDKSDREIHATDAETDNSSKLHNIESVLDTYISKIDHCLELINIELDGK